MIKKMKPSPKLKTGIILVLLIAFFLILNLTGLSKGIKNFFYLISSPTQKVFWKGKDKVSDFFETISEMKNLKKENEELKLKIQGLLTENVSLLELKKENEILREALNLGLEKEFKLSLSRVIGKDISQDFILIDKGLRDGISPDLAVITEQKVLVGKIEEVYKNFSKVKLTTHEKNSFDVKIISPDFIKESFFQSEAHQDRDQSSNSIYGIVKGKGNPKLFLDLVPREKEIKEGDLVVTSGLSGNFPSGLLVAQITKVEKSDIEPFQKANLIPAFDIKEIEILFIIKESEK